MYDAFISYRRKNGFWAAKMIRELLKAKGVTAYMDLDELRSGVFSDKLLNAIRTSPYFLLVLPPDALERCCDKEDWMTKEIVTAIDSGREIIPILCDGFSWPTQWPDTVPAQVRAASTYHGIELTPYYVDAMIDLLVERIRGSGNTSGKSDLDTFFRNRMWKLENVKGVDLAFHSGSSWLENIDRLDILEDLAQAGIRMRILVNSPLAAESVAKYMRHKIKKYMSFEEAIQRWQAYAEMYDNMEVRVSDIPFFRVYYAFTMENEEDGAVRVKYYTYGNAKIEKNYSQNFESRDACYGLYKTEFEFLWDRAQPSHL